MIHKFVLMIVLLKFPPATIYILINKFQICLINLNDEKHELVLINYVKLLSVETEVY